MAANEGNTSRYPMRGRLAILITTSLCATGTFAQARPETWSCRAPGGREVLVVATHQGGDAGTISVAGTEYETRYEVEGFNRRWTFGPVTRDNKSLRFLFRMEPDGDAAYFDFNQGTGAQQAYSCELQGGVAERTRESVERERRALDEPPRELVAEAPANPARAAALLDQYMLMIKNHVERYWERPLSARPGIECSVNVMQLPTGEVVSAKVAQCNGDDAVRRSIESAVFNASPLPRPPSQDVFSRTLTLTFSPDE